MLQVKGLVIRHIGLRNQAALTAGHVDSAGTTTPLLLKRI